MTIHKRPRRDLAKCTEAAPELVALVRAPASRSDETASRAFRRSPVYAPADRVMQRLNRTISSRDEIFDCFEAVQPGSYFSSGVSQLVRLIQVA